MTSTPPQTVQELTLGLLGKLASTENKSEWRQLAMDLVDPLIAYWGVFPPEAMERLQQAVFWLPVHVARPMVREVVLGWRAIAGYHPREGSASVGCYISALILSDNSDLLEYPWADELVPGVVRIELDARRDQRDAAAKATLVKRIAESMDLDRLK